MKQKAIKLPKGVGQEFLDSIQSKLSEELKAIVVTLQLQNEENEMFKQSPEYLKEKEMYETAKERFQLIAGPIKDITVSIKNKTKVVIDRLKEKGQI